MIEYKEVTIMDKSVTYMNLSIIELFDCDFPMFQQTFKIAILANNNPMKIRPD